MEWSSSSDCPGKPSGSSNVRHMEVLRSDAILWKMSVTLDFDFYQHESFPEGSWSRSIEVFLSSSKSSVASCPFLLPHSLFFSSCLQQRTIISFLYDAMRSIRKMRSLTVSHTATTVTCLPFSSLLDCAISLCPFRMSLRTSIENRCWLMEEICHSSKKSPVLEKPLRYSYDV